MRGTERAVVMGGDYNIVPEPVDAKRPETLVEDATYRPEVRAAWRRLVFSGWTDALRALHPNSELYSYWDYRGQSWRANNGMRIDHLLLSPQATDRLLGAGIERKMRGRPKPSDHVPVWCDLAVLAD